MVASRVITYWIMYIRNITMLENWYFTCIVLQVTWWLKQITWNMRHLKYWRSKERNEILILQKSLSDISPLQNAQSILFHEQCFSIGIFSELKKKKFVCRKFTKLHDAIWNTKHNGIYNIDLFLWSLFS